MIETLTWGWAGLSFWQHVLIALVVTHITIAAVTIFLHRCQAHRSLELHPSISHFFRFWLWLTTSMVTREWAAVHRKHHAKTETEEDPHSPQIHGLASVLWGGVIHYARARKDPETIERYGYGTPDDWVERNVYSRFPSTGIVLLAFINVGLFGLVPGIAIWGVQMVWIPFWAAGVINGVGHYWGYRNFQPQDESRNIVPLGVIIGGEELHNNHHAFPTSARLSNRWYEFDIGWLYIRLMEKAGLARVKRTAPRLLSVDSRSSCDLDTLQSIITNRLEVMSRYARSVKKVCHSELEKIRLKEVSPPSAKVVTDWLQGMEQRVNAIDRQKMEKFIEQSPVARKIFDMRQQLVSLWEDRDVSAERLVERLRQWCKEAEESGIESLRRFSADLRGYRTAPSPTS
jgi:stearoyl-CoA desaturase (delta-9 desaturase)